MIKFIFVGAVLAQLAFGTTAKVTFRNGSTGGPDIRLADIAEISCSDLSTVQKLKEIKVGKAALHGHLRRISTARVKKSLSRSPVG